MGRPDGGMGGFAVKRDTTAPLDLLPDLYAAATEQDRWPVFLQRLAALFHTDTATLRIIDLGTPAVRQSHVVGFDPVVSRRYVEEYVLHDPFRDYLERLPIGRCGLSHQVIADAHYARSPHYQMVFRPNGNFYAMGGDMERRHGRALQIGVHRPRAVGRFSDLERQSLELFAPHFRQASRLMRLLARMDTALQQSRAALDAMATAVWLLDGDCCCRWMNQSAEDVIENAAYGITLAGGRLTLVRRGEVSPVRKAVACVRGGAGVTRTVPLESDGTHLLLVPAVGRGEGVESGLDGGVLAFLVDPSRPAPLDASLLRELYGLTPAESRLAAEFVGGLDIGAISVRLGVSVHTVRTQLKSIMAKTGATRQADLMRLLLAGPAQLRGGDNQTHA